MLLSIVTDKRKHRSDYSMFFYPSMKSPIRKELLAQMIAVKGARTKAWLHAPFFVTV
jgi:hypothetical protein